MTSHAEEYTPALAEQLAGAIVDVSVVKAGAKGVTSTSAVVSRGADKQQTNKTNTPTTRSRDINDKP